MPVRGYGGQGAPAGGAGRVRKGGREGRREGGEGRVHVGAGREATYKQHTLFNHFVSVRVISVPLPPAPQIAAEFRTLEAGVSRYNQLAHRLKLVPASAKRADGVSYELRLNRDAAAPAEFSNLDLKVAGEGGL